MILKAPPLLLIHAHLREVWLRPAFVSLTIQNALLLDPEQPVKDDNTLL